MTDLRTRFATLDRLTAPDLWAEVERRAMAPAIGDPTKVAAGQLTWRLGHPTMAPASNRRFVLVLVALGLLLAAIVGVAIVGGLPPDPLQAELPPAVVATESPRSIYRSPLPSSPTEESEASQTSPPLGERVTSERYEYWLRVPAGWHLAALARKTWSGPRPWQAGETDTYTDAEGARTFEIAARPVPAGTSQEAFLQTYLSPQVEARGIFGCGYNGGPITGPYIGSHSAGWHDISHRVYPTRVRAGCDRIDGVVFVDTMAYVMTLSQVGLNLNVFDRFLSGLAPTSRQPPLAFQSSRYGYSLQVPGDWIANSATESWSGETGRPDGAIVDSFVGRAEPGVPRLTIASRPRADTTSEDRFVADAAPLPEAVRLDGPAVHCDFGETVLERGPIPPWIEEMIGGHRARVRSMCGTVDAVVFVGDRGFLFSLRSDTLTRGDIDRFHELVSSVRFADTFDLDALRRTSQPMRSFSSDRYGYSIGYPVEWRAVPAVKSWDGDGAWTDRMADRFIDPAGGERSFIIVSARLAGAIVDDAWLARFVPRPEGTGGSYCVLRTEGGHIMPYATSVWTEATLAGRPARVRPLCGGAAGVQAVLTVDDRAYVLWLMVPVFSPSFDAVDTFNQIADTFRIDP